MGDLLASDGMKTLLPLKPLLARLILFPLLASTALTTLRAETYEWFGNTSNFYATASNWTPDGLPATGDTVEFTNNASRTDVHSGTNRVIGTMRFSASRDYILTAFNANNEDRTFTIGSALTLNGTGNITMDAGVAFSASAMINGSGSSTLSFERNLTGARPLYLEGSGSYRILVNQGQAANTGFNTLSNGNATLGGIGTLSRQLLIDPTGGAGATIAPGIDGAAGTFTLAAGFSSGVSTHFAFDLGGEAGSNDRLLITGGTFSLHATEAGAFSISLNSLGVSAPQLETPITLIEATPDVTLDFSGLSAEAFAIADLPDGWLLDTTYGNNGLLFDPATGHLSVQLSTIPEPSQAVLCTLTLGTLAGYAALSRRRGLTAISTTAKQG